MTVDGKEVTVPQGAYAFLEGTGGFDGQSDRPGSALIQACEAAGATIPR